MSSTTVGTWHAMSLHRSLTAYPDCSSILQAFSAEDYTFRRRPVELVYVGFFEDINEAISWEKKVKRWSRKKKEALIQDNSEALHKLSECKNTTHYRNKDALPPLVSARGDNAL